MYEQLQEMLANPENDDRPLRELQQEARAGERSRLQKSLTAIGASRVQRPEDAGDTSLLCEPPDLFEVIFMSPLPLRIDVHADRVVLHQQHWNVIREVPLGRQPAVASGDASRYGDATARFEGETLIVETVNILSMSLRGPVTSENTRLVERYTPSQQGSRLDVEVTLIDSETFNEPQTFYRPLIRTPDAEIYDDDPCAGLE